MATHKTIDRLKAGQKKSASVPAKRNQTTATSVQAGREHRVIDRRQAGQKQTASVPTAPARGQSTGGGGYYSPREYGVQTGAYEARVTAARAEMEQRSEAMRRAQQALEQLNAQVQEKRNRYQELTGTFEGDTAAEYERRILDDWTQAVDLYDEGRQKWEQEYAAYKPYEDAYNAALGEYNAYVSAERAEYDRWRGSIRDSESIRQERAGIKEKRAELQRLMQEQNAIASGTASPGIQAQAAQNEARIKELQEYLGGVGEREKLLAEELDWSEHFRFEDLRQNGDFAEKSRFTGADNWGDRVYQYVNGNPNAGAGTPDGLLDSLQDGRNRPAPWTLEGMINRDLNNEAVRDILNINKTPTRLGYMTEDEKAMYNYVYHTQGDEAANAYLEYLDPELNERETAARTGKAREFAGKNALTAALASAGSVLLSPASGLYGIAGQAASALRGEELDPNASYNLMANTKNAIRDEVSGKIQEHAGPVGSFAYGTVMSMADMAMDAAVGNPFAATALIGTRAFSEQVIDSKNRGLSDEQALTMGFASAFAELVTEKLGLDAKLHLPKEWATAGFWKGAARGAGGEALEEGLTNLMNLAADISIAGDKSEFAQSVERYKAEGLSEEKAVWKALGDAGISLALDAAGGAISGGVYGGFRGYRGKKAAEAQEKAEKAAKLAEEEMPPQSQSDSSPIPDGTGEPLGAAPVAGKATSVSAPLSRQADSSPMQGTGEPLETAQVAGSAEESSAVKKVSTQAVQENVQKGTTAPETVREDRTVGESVNENGGNSDGKEAGEHVLPGSPERDDAAGAGEPVGGYAEHRERQQTEARSQAEAAAQRRVKAENLEKRGHLRRVSSQDLGLRQGTEVQELLELPRIEWDQELYDTAARLEKETGMQVRTVTGNIGVRLKGGGVGLAKGYIDRASKTIVLNVCHSQVTAGQIADHELWHHKMETVGRIGGNRYEVTRLAAQRIQEQYSPEDFDEVLDAYIDGYGDVYDQSNWEEFLNRVYEEIMADAYAGMNAFGVEASKFRSTVDDTMDELGMGRNMWNASEQEDTPAPGGDQRVYADEDAPPMPEYEDYSQVPEYEWDGFDGNEVDYSYGGENARNADREALERAQRMEEQGFDKRQIFRDTGWFRGADGKWRFEIDDSGMKYHRAGDAQFAKDHAEYRTYKELERKFIDGTITEQELAQMQELSGTWFREAGRLGQRVARGNATLANMLDHDALFEAYPQLREVKVRFGDTGDNADGWWDESRNEIVFSERLRHADSAYLEGVLLHEIQHAIQDMEGFARGSSPKYWEDIQNSDRAIRVNDRKIAKAEREAQEALRGLPQEVVRDFWYAANMMENDPEGAQKLDEELMEGEYAEAYGDYSWAIWTLQELAEQGNPKRTAKDLYRNTAGEIEARDAAYRRGMDTGERKKHLPNTGDENTVFAESLGRSGDVRFSMDSEGREYTMRDIGALQQERYQLKAERDRLLNGNPNYAKAMEDRRYANNFKERAAASRALRAAEAEVDTASIDRRMAEIDDLIAGIREAERLHHQQEQEKYSGTKTAGYSLLPDSRIRELDAEYDEAVKSRNRKRMEELVQQAAEAAMPQSVVRGEDGKLLKVYHYTNGKFTAFDRGMARTGNEMDGFFFAPDPESSKEYGDNVVVAYLNITNLAKDPYLDRLHDDSGTLLREKLAYEGYDGVARTEADGSIYEYMAFDPEQIKSAEPIVRDDRGRVIPLSERFDFKSNDIRFSLDGSLSREEYDRLAAEVAGDQSKRNEEFVKSKLTPEQYKQYKAFAREDRLDQEAEARVRGIERLEEAQAREDLAALRARQAEDAAAGRRELAAEEKAARAEAREKAGTARQERRRKAQEKREKLRQEAKERIRRAAENAPTDSVPTIARKELQDKLISLFSVGEGQRGELRREIGQLADRMIAEGTVDEQDLRRLIDRLYASGVMVIEPEQVMAEGRSYLKDEHIYISPEQIRELGDDWLDLRKKAWGLGVYLTTDRSYAGLDVWNADMATYLPGLFNENETDSRRLLERLLHIAQEGKAEKVSLPEYTKRIAKAEHQSEEALLYNMERQVEEALRTFGEKASLEMRLKNRNARRRAMDREEAAIVRENESAERERLRQDLKDERAYLKERNEAERDRLRLERAENDRRNAAERRRLAEERAARRRKHQEAVRKKELRELQEKTLKALQWISKNRRKAPEAMQEAFTAVLGNIDLYAISMADEMNWSSKYGATWKDLKQMYLHAQATDPNFMPSKDLDLIVQRLDSVQLESMDFDQLRDLYQAAVGLRTEFYNRNNVIGSEEHQIMEELYNSCVEEMRTAPKKLKGMLDRFLNLEQLTPMNVFEEMGGFNPDGALYKFAQQLEAGERKVRSFKVRSNKILADFLEDNADWIHRADGQGKDGIWIEVEIPQLIGMKVGEVPEFGGTVKVAMTPMQRVHLYLESRNYDNLRHMTGGRTFADRELYSQGKREEAFAKGTTIRMAPETVQLLVKDMSPEELELARLLDKYYNDLAATEINKVSNILLGYNKAMGGHYAPIFTDKNYTESEFGRYDCTAEGAGNLKERNHYSKVPSYNISALDAFERNMDRTATYVGMAIPSRNWATLMKWKAGDSSFKAEIDHTWGPERKKYIETLITDLQNPMGEQQDMVTEMSGKLLSNYISSVFGFNPSIVVKQLGSIPMASAYLDWKHFPKGVIGKGKINRELIGRYTQELDWRTMGYSMPETKQLKDAPNWSQKNKVVGLVFGGDAITAMDGWAASVLWPWAENKVRAEFPGLEVGDAAMIESGQSPFYQKVAELFNDAVSRSQSVSDQMHQGRLRKSKHAAAKAVTMFRSDSAQSYNVLRQRLGELDYYRRQGEGGKVMAEAAKKAVGAAATAVLINSIWGTAVDLLVKALKGKLDEEDKEPLQIAEDFFWGVIDSYAGMVITGDILAETVGNWFTGEMRFDQEAPGVEQFNDILQAADKIINAGKKGNLIGAIKIGAETIATYGYGLPVKNVEAYLMGLFSWALPGAKVAYEDLLKAPAKADLKGLEGDALTVRLNHVLKGYGVELEPDVREALAALYEAGYTEAVPSAAPDSVTVDGVELELDGRMKKEYDKTRGGIIERELPEITGSAFFAQADEKTRKAMVTKLYNYAAEKAKEAVLEDYAIGTTAQAIDEIVRSGGSAADYSVFDAVTADMAAWQRAEVLQEWGTDDAVTGLMFKYLVSKSWEDEQAELRKVGVDVGQFLELYAMHGEIDSRDLKAGQKATEFAYWLDGQRYTDQQKDAIKDQMEYRTSMVVEATKYNRAVAAGLDREQALELTEGLDDLGTDPEEVQKYRVAIDQSVGESNQLKMLAAAGLKDSSYDKVAKGYEMGVAPAAWVRVKEVQQQFDANGNGSMTNAEWEAAIEGICSYGIVLPGDNTRFNLTNEQKGVLWQMMVGKSTKSKNNPFDPAAGQRWRELMGYE